MGAAETARHVRILKAIGVKNRRSRIPKQKYPKGIELEYANAMIGHLAVAKQALAPLLHALPGLLERARKARGDAGDAGDRLDADETAELKHLLANARAQLASAVNPTAVEAVAKKFGNRTIEFNRQQLGRQVKAALGVDVVGHSPSVAALLNHFLGENVALIKSIPEQVHDQVEGIVNRAFSNGAMVGTVADDIEERFSVGESRARLIARDQVGKLYGQTNAARQRDLGVQFWFWRTSGDERVRPEHEALDGQRFSNDDPPSEGVPGEPIQCRCTMEPDFTDLRDAVDNGDDP